MSQTSKSRFKDFESIIINNDQFEKCLKIELSDSPDKVNIRKLLSYLKCNGWLNYKFNDYSVRSINELGTLVTISYVPPILKFK